MNMKKMISILMITSIFLLSSCNKNPSDDDSSFDVTLKIFPDIGSTGTEFTLTMIQVSGSDLVQDGGYHYRVDWDGDGRYDTDWLDTLNVRNSYNSDGRKKIVVQVEDEQSKKSSGEYYVYIQKLEQIVESRNDRIGQYNPDWCPDGSNRIAYEWSADFDPTHHAIWVVTYPDGEPELLLQREGDFLFFPEWSPDGKNIALASNENGFGIYNLQEDSLYFPGIYHYFWSRWSLTEGG